MNGFESLKKQQQSSNATSTSATPDELFEMTREDIERSVARAHQLRAEQFAVWGRNVARACAGAFGHRNDSLPTRTAFGRRLVHSSEL
jgi:hypothetical protein